MEFSLAGRSSDPLLVDEQRTVVPVRRRPSQKSIAIRHVEQGNPFARERRNNALTRSD